MKRKLKLTIGRDLPKSYNIIPLVYLALKLFNLSDLTVLVICSL